MQAPDYSFYVVCDSEVVLSTQISNPAILSAAKEATFAGRAGTCDMLAINLQPVNAMGACSYSGGWLNGLVTSDSNGGYQPLTMPAALIGEDGAFYDYRFEAGSNQGLSGHLIRAKVRSTALYEDAAPETQWSPVFGYDLGVMDWLAPGSWYGTTTPPESIYWRSNLYWDQGPVLSGRHRFSWFDAQQVRQYGGAKEMLREGERNSVGSAVGFASDAADLCRSPGDGVARFADGSTAAFSVVGFEGYA